MIQSVISEAQGKQKVGVFMPRKLLYCSKYITEFFIDNLFFLCSNTV